LKQRYLANPDVAPRDEADGTRFNRYEDLHDPFYPRFWEDRLNEPRHLGGGQFGMATIPKGIFTVDMGELFGEWIPREWQDKIFDVIRACPQHRFYLLTKQPQNLVKFLGGNITNTRKGYRKPEPLPNNVWMGVTVTDRQSAYGARDFLKEVRAKVKFLSLEPLLGKMDGDALGNIIPLADWIIIGGQSGSKKFYPPEGWIQEIEQAADNAGIPVFEKNNLRQWTKQSRQEMPK